MSLGSTIALIKTLAGSGGGGGGGGLPPYENEGINKVLALADSDRTVTETLVAIEEQTVTTVKYTGTAHLTIDYTYWAPGRTVHLTVNGNNYDCIIDSSGYIQVTDDGHVVKIWRPDAVQAANFQGHALKTYTVSAMIEALVPIPAPAWVPNTPFVINVSSEIIDEELVLAADKTPSETTAAFNSGRAIYIAFSAYGAGRHPVSDIEIGPAGTIIIRVERIEVDPTNGVHSTEFSFIPYGDEYAVNLEEQTFPPENNGD